jgi:hypothetical protein
MPPGGPGRTHALLHPFAAEVYYAAIIETGSGPMASSFKDQLLKAGLVDPGRAKKEKHDKIKNSIQQRRKAPAAATAGATTERTQATERDRQLNLQRKQAADKKALAAQLKQLIEANRLPRGDGEVAYNFTDSNKIQRLYVSAAMHKQIAGGGLAIVKLETQYDVVPAAIAQKIRERDAASVVLWLDPQQSAGGRDDEAEHPVPDDLIW